MSNLEAVLLKRIERERKARFEAERLLEEKSVELHEVNLGLRSWSSLLEEIVEERTAELTQALDETRKANSHIEHQALHDPLTGLPNRRYLKQILEDWAGDKNSPNGIAILHIDLDRFKQINDSRGHAAGDFVLTHTASILTALVRTEDFVARIGGDEFVIVTRTDGNTKSLEALANRITVQLARPVLYKKNFCRFGASVGIAYSRSKSIDPSKLLINADIALYRAKNSGRGRYAFFSSALQKEILEEQNIAEAIIHGLDQGEFFPVYQPQFDAKTLDIVGVEAMVRWNHPEKGILAPASFLKVAENIKMIDRIDSLILERGLRDIISFQESEVVVPKLSVNISSHRLLDPDLLKSIAKLRLPKGLVAFELIESIFLDDSEADISIQRTIKRLKKLGIDIEIDDFGTGHASIVGLLCVEPARLKIAQELVMPITRSRKQRQLVRSIIEMGQALNIGIVAEGVETMEHAEILRDLGCETMQGYMFAMPMSAPQLFHFLKKKIWREKLNTPHSPDMDAGDQPVRAAQ